MRHDPALEALGIAPPPPRRPMRLWSALRRIARLLEDPTRTEEVFEVFSALGGDGGEKIFRRFLADPDGRRLIACRRALVDALADRAALAALPDGSLGRAYLAHLERNGLDPLGVVEAAHRVHDARGINTDPHRRWFGDRIDLMHDLWHVLTGYGTDEEGEAALLAFSYPHLPQLALLLLVLAAAWVGPWGRGFAWQRYLVRAWLRGRRARPLVVVAWEELLPRPLAQVRQALGVEAPEAAHPGGVWSGSLTSRAGAPQAAAAR